MFPAKAARRQSPEDPAGSTAHLGHTWVRFGAVGRRRRIRLEAAAMNPSPLPTVLQSINTRHSNILQEQPKTSQGFYCFSLRTSNSWIQSPQTLLQLSFANLSPSEDAGRLKGSKHPSLPSPSLQSGHGTLSTSSKPEPEPDTPFQQLQCAPDKAHPHSNHTNGFIMAHAYVPH